MRPNLITAIATLGLVALTSCTTQQPPASGSTKAATPAVASASEQPSDGWETSSLVAQQINPELIEAMVRAIRADEFTGIDGVLLVRYGVLVLEQYFGKSDREELHNMRSAAKAITAALVGIAIDKGFIESAEVPLLPFFPEYDGTIANWDERKRDITLAHLLSMTSGVRGNEDAMYPTDDWIKFFLDQPLVATPGTQFSYATSGAVTLGNVITRASKLRIPAFADRYLFEPLGIKESHWPITNSLGSQGLAMTGGGLALRLRDMAKVGQLHLDGGTWKGQRVLSQAWVDDATSALATSDMHGEGFGYQWHIVDRQVEGDEVTSFEAWGNGGQFIMVFPSLELVAVFTGHNYGLFPEMEQPFLLMDRYVLPAMK